MILVNIAELPRSPERARNAAMFAELVKLGRPFDEGIFVDPPILTGLALERAARPKERWAALRKSIAITEVEHRVWSWSPSFFLPSSGRKSIHRPTAALFGAVLRRHLRGRPFCLLINTVEAGPFALANSLARHAKKVV